MLDFRKFCEHTKRSLISLEHFSFLKRKRVWDLPFHENKEQLKRSIIKI